MRQERFTEQAQEALQSSQQMAMQLKHSQWDVEHILLALLAQQKGLVGEIFKELGVDIEATRRKVEASLESTPKVAYQTGQPPKGHAATTKKVQSRSHRRLAPRRPRGEFEVKELQQSRAAFARCAIV